MSVTFSAATFGDKKWRKKNGKTAALDNTEKDAVGATLHMNEVGYGVSVNCSQYSATNLRTLLFSPSESQEVDL